MGNLTIGKLSPNPNVALFAKLEGNNPGGSVKDRAALHMIRNAMERGDITPTTRLVEATSGNTGIALAMMARVFGLSIELVMPASSTRERTLTMEAFGAQVTLLDSIEACRDYAEEKGAQPDYYVFNQFANGGVPPRIGQKFLHTHGAQRHTLVNLHAVADHRRLANYHTRSMVYAKIRPNRRGWMDIDTGLRMGMFREDPWQ